MKQPEQMNCSLLNKILSPLLLTPASSRTCNNNGDDDVEPLASSCFQRTVCLYDWWLVKADKDYEGKRIAVAGLTSREHQAMRIFTSAPVIKRYDYFTLETADGIVIVIKGLLNKMRTMENGFSSEVYSHFMFGFPSNWEVCAEKCLGKKYVTGIHSAMCPEYNKEAANLESVAGLRNSNSDAVLRNHKVNCECNYIAGDVNRCSEDVSENSSNASKSSDLTGHVADCNDIANSKNHALKNLLPVMSCSINNVNSVEDNLAVPAEASSYRMTGTSAWMVNSRSCRKGSIGTATKSTTKEKANLESITFMSAASEKSPVHKGSDVDNATIPSNLKSFVVASRTTSSGPKSSKEQKEIDKIKCVLSYRNKNISTASVSQESEAILRSSGKKSSRVETNLLKFDLRVMHEESLFISIGGEPDNLECSENCVDDDVFTSAVQTDVTVNAITPSQVDPNAVNASVNSRNRKGGNCLRSLNSNQKRNSGFSASVKCLSKDLTSEAFSNGDNLKRCSSQQTTHSERTMDTLKTTGSQCLRRSFRNFLENFEGREKERVSVVYGLKANSVSLLSVETSNIVQEDKMCGEPQEQSDTVKVNLKQGRYCKKIPKAGTSRQYKNNFAKCPSGLGDKNHNNNLKTAVGGRERNAKVARRKINFEAQASPLTPERTEESSIVSPESLSLRRSRSGRLLVPSLDFWRNQIAVYDADRKITGIQKGLDILKLSKGTKSEPPKKRRCQN